MKNLASLALLVRVNDDFDSSLLFEATMYTHPKFT